MRAGRCRFCGQPTGSPHAPDCREQPTANGWQVAEAAAWKDRQKRQAITEAQQARFNAEVGPCPACGASANVEMIEVTFKFDDPQFVPGVARCSNECWRIDPDRYLAAVRQVAPNP